MPPFLKKGIESGRTFDLGNGTDRIGALSYSQHWRNARISTVGSSSATRSSGSPRRGEKTWISLNSSPTGYRGRIRSETSSSNSTQLGLPRSVATRPALDPNPRSEPDSGIRWAFMEAAAICFFPALERQAEGAAQLILDSILPLAPTSIQ